MYQTEDLYELSHRLGKHLSTIEQNSVQRISEMVTPSEFKVLEILVATGATMLSSLADLLGLTPASLTYIADKLTTRGLVNRKYDEVDRRVVRLEITELGGHLVADVQNERNVHIHRLFGTLSNSEVMSLVDICNKLLDSIETRPIRLGSQNI
ncbi:MarR family transcriptional regulator [Alicyclobacillus fastidiosus]|uniref:MarR family transcriptional regulator n=1 Tax=Alicyclobacillus fastidiosus TaxID=392011 RepID=A0ABY6ZFU3_9BACL|nr:MarR family transcriptional regulator [Alicyclobacillus fastidiosus]WAH41790.1 MarR family transcriptional regulator [Alicyclobacillus fastidiosus]GMA63485.1 hypothetical protein GCM10025859_39250 [Alicyclobacillus fastidiosus]